MTTIKIQDYVGDRLLKIQFSICLLCIDTLKRINNYFNTVYYARTIIMDFKLMTIAR